MKIAIASGKGGTGKTTVAASLLAVWDAPCIAVDLDVEEPNLHCFVQPSALSRAEVSLRVPVVDSAKCTGCGACAEACQYQAIAMLGTTPTAFPSMCHSCGGCFLVCREGALNEGARILGELEEGIALGHPYLTGRLRVGEAMSPPLIRAVTARLEGLLDSASPGVRQPDAILDSPPGVSCPAMTAAMNCDAVVLVAESTPFGLYDFSLAVEAFSSLGKPLGVVINRAGLGDDSVERLCQEKGLPVLVTIPYDPAIAVEYAHGRLASSASPAVGMAFTTLRDAVRGLVQEQEPMEEAAHG